MAKKKNAFGSSPPGSGARFKKCVQKLGSEALCAHIGRKKYGKRKFQKMAAKGKK